MGLDPADFHRLKEGWAAVRSSSDSRTGFDPDVSLRWTGTLLSAVERVMATAQPKDARQEMDRAS